MSQQSLDNTPSDAELLAQNAREREYEADRTPTPVVRQYLEIYKAELDQVDCEPERILDPAAGSGVFGMVCRQLWPNATIVAIEPREEEAANLRRWYDEVNVCRFEQWFSHKRVRSVDLVTTNPPFTLWRQYVEMGVETLRHGGDVIYLLPSALGHAQGASKVFRHAVPTHQGRVVGRINFRGPGVNPETKKKWTSDERDVSWWRWGDVSSRTGGWHAINLPILPAADRRWTVPPGTEDENGELAPTVLDVRKP